MAGEPKIGERLWTTRAGSEGDLVEEIRGARILGEALVVSAPVPELSPTFARQGMNVDLLVQNDIANAAIDKLTATRGPVALHVWTPDTDAGNRLAPGASAIEERIRAAMPDRLSRRAPIEQVTLVQVAVIAEGVAVLGAEPLLDAQSPWPGGRARMKVRGDKPSRAARKIEEALALFRIEPGAGELCVDLGAAPGGWTWVLVQRRARVIAVDPAQLRDDLRRDRRVWHVKASAFDYAPDEPVDWLFCDMAWRPLEVAQLLAKWGRRDWARLMVANIKLPMKKKVEIVAKVRATLAQGGWSRIVTRQLYHDRDEITVLAART